jgi:hypothetical protein
MWRRVAETLSKGPVECKALQKSYLGEQPDTDETYFIRLCTKKLNQPNQKCI